MTRSARFAFATLLLTLAATILIGCGVRRSLPLRLDYPPDLQASAVDVSSFGGTITIVASPLAEGIGIETRIRIPRWVSPDDVDAVFDAAQVTAKTIEREGLGVLVVDVTTSYPDDTASNVDVTITMPQVQGTRVRLVQGEVELVNIQGAVEVHLVAGDITVRTNEAMIDPVLLVTGKGQVNYIVSPDSTGEMDIRALAGRVDYRCRAGITTDMTVSRDAFHGILNSDGSNQIKLQSGEGDILVIIRTNAGNLLNPH
ncbi:MAG: hypothetical protein KAS72_15275 [Phycisphaerales bacterium]|nr:hypothetical protein [Phycisphaerales bacterium]